MNIIRCNTNVANVMKEPNHKSELHTQLLYNDKAEIVEVYNSHWIKILTESKQTTGWVLNSQFDETDEAEPEKCEHIIIGNSSYLRVNNAVMALVSGTYISRKDELFHLHPQDKTELNSITFNEEFKLQILNSFINAPYMWGGTTVYGIDCSGLSKIFYKFFSVHLPHLASAQMQSGTVLDFLSNAACGDLAFFENEQNDITHVGILLNSEEVIHASESNGRVMIDNIDNHGIINKKSGQRTHTLRLIKRIL